MLDVVVERFLQLAVFGISVYLRRMITNKVHAVNSFFGSVNPTDERIDPNGKTTVLWV